MSLDEKVTEVEDFKKAAEEFRNLVFSRERDYRKAIDYFKSLPLEKQTYIQRTSPYNLGLRIISMKSV